MKNALTPTTRTGDRYALQIIFKLYIWPFKSSRKCNNVALSLTKERMTKELRNLECNQWLMVYGNDFNVGEN